MHDIDLIPEDYRENRWKRRMLMILGGITLLVAAIGLAAGLGLRMLNNNVREEINILQGQQAVTNQQRNTMETLRSQLDQMRQQRKLMDKLRTGSEAVQMFRAIDAALTDRKVWFRKWEFRRAMEVVDQSKVGLQQSSPESGFFIVIPIGQAQPKYWEISNHMTIAGEASDHHELSRFVASLFAQPEIRDVKVLTANRRTYPTFNAVAFDIAVVVEPGLES